MHPLIREVRKTVGCGNDSGKSNEQWKGKTKDATCRKKMTGWGNQFFRGWEGCKEKMEFCTDNAFTSKRSVLITPAFFVDLFFWSFWKEYTKIQFKSERKTGKVLNEKAYSLMCSDQERIATQKAIGKMSLHRLNFSLSLRCSLPSN